MSQHFAIPPPATSPVWTEAGSPRPVEGINFQDASASRGEVSPEAQSPLRAENVVSRLQLGAHGLPAALPARGARDEPGTWERISQTKTAQPRLFNMAEALGAGSPPPGRVSRPSAGCHPVQADLDAPPASQPARSPGAGAGSSSSPSPRGGPPSPFSSYTPRHGKTDRGAVHSLRGALAPPPARGCGRAPGLVGATASERNVRGAHVSTLLPS